MKTKSGLWYRDVGQTDLCAIGLLLLISLPAKLLYAQVTVSGVSPSPLVAPLTSTNSPYNGYFFITGQNFPSNASVSTDGPLDLIGSPVITDTLIVQEYQIGCCAPTQGEVFHLSVSVPSSGSTEITDTISLRLDRAGLQYVGTFKWRMVLERKLQPPMAVFFPGLSNPRICRAES